MTREGAIRAAEREAAIATTAIAVYRFPAWPPDVYGVRAAERLPTEAQKFEVFRPLVLESSVTPCQIAETSKSASKTPRTSCLPTAGQGSLF